MARPEDQDEDFEERPAGRRRPRDEDEDDRPVRRSGEVVGVQVIPRPHEDVNSVLPLAGKIPQTASVG